MRDCDWLPRDPIECTEVKYRKLDVEGTEYSVGAPRCDTLILHEGLAQVKCPGTNGNARKKVRYALKGCGKDVAWNLVPTKHFSR